jgi:hypothetical protein
MASPFFSIRISKNRQGSIVPYSYIRNGDSRGDYSSLKEDNPNGISSPREKIASHKGGTGK